ncbi:hypothetical protein HPB50_023698 [Hyalomma asiaticum]|uniref:Uncharacterized protein n=1 Tax=Hyalomma asiaticum TaxID=266040 RepID=A0ACB7TAI8_HYAAI|nr:hypothetical protein HPB50_023698 [Hyalomma asiaticum]
MPTMVHAISGASSAAIALPNQDPLAATVQRDISGSGISLSMRTIGARPQHTAKADAMPPRHATGMVDKAVHITPTISQACEQTVAKAMGQNSTLDELRSSPTRNDVVRLPAKRTPVTKLVKWLSETQHVSMAVVVRVVGRWRVR